MKSAAKVTWYPIDTVAMQKRPRALMAVIQLESGFFTLCEPDTEWSIGRSASSHIVLADNTLSMRHALIERDLSFNFYLRDCGSRNGTMLGNFRLGAHRNYLLRSGAEFRIGAQRFRFLRCFDLESVWPAASELKTSS